MSTNDTYLVQRPCHANGPQLVRRARPLRRGDPAVRGHEPPQALATGGVDVGQASAAPGERRNVTPAKEPTKAELLELAKSKGVEVQPYATKAEIAEALEEA